MYRRATSREIRDVASQLENYELWEKVFEYVAEYYDINKVYCAKFKTGRYEDYPYKEYLEMVYAYNEDGNVLPFDYSLEMFQEVDYRDKTKTYAQVCEEAYQKSMAEWEKNEKGSRWSSEEKGKEEAILSSHYALGGDRPDFYPFSDDDTFYRDAEKEFGKNWSNMLLYVKEEEQHV